MINNPNEYNTLSQEEQKVILHKGTEKPFTGKYYLSHDKGTYVCKQCHAPLYRSEDKFDSHCGWPSFDDEIAGAVKRVLDADGQRTEIVCNHCNGHLGHVFIGERLTPKNIRHCVNSISMHFIPDAIPIQPDTAIFAGGCFWGVEYYFMKQPGVIATHVGYIGGHKINPTYKEVCSSFTGHAEAIQVIYNPTQTDYRTLCKLFFEIHDPTQLNRQGPDIGEQYRSEIFYTSEEQKKTAEELIQILKNEGYPIVTKLTFADIFWMAEDYHQQYYAKEKSQPYCHKYTKRFKD